MEEQSQDEKNLFASTGIKFEDLETQVHQYIPVARPLVRVLRLSKTKILYSRRLYQPEAISLSW